MNQALLGKISNEGLIEAGSHHAGEIGAISAKHLGHFVDGETLTLIEFMREEESLQMVSHIMLPSHIILGIDLFVLVFRDDRICIKSECNEDKDEDGEATQEYVVYEIIGEGIQGFCLDHGRSDDKDNECNPPVEKPTRLGCYDETVLT